MKRFLAIIFLLIFTTQVLPVKSIGKMMCNGQNTEEVHESANNAKLPFHCHDKYWYLHLSSLTDADNANAKKNTHIIQDEALIKCFHLEVLLQPPDIS